MKKKIEHPYFNQSIKRPAVEEQNKEQQYISKIIIQLLN